MTRKLIVYLPSLIILLILLYKPPFLLASGGDIDYHFVRAQEIIQDPIKGLYWDTLRCYPDGKAVNHQPLFHVVAALLWKLGGVRFAHSILVIFQIVLTSWTASFFAKRYGVIAGISAGAFVLFSPRIDYLGVALPSAYLFPLILLTIHFLLEDKTKYAFILAFVALLTHPGALFVFPLIFLLDDYRKRDNIKASLGLLPLWGIYVAYWLYFRGQMGQEVGADLQTSFTGFFNAVILHVQRHPLYYVLAIPGVYVLQEKKEAKLLLATTGVLTLFTIYYGDVERYLQYISLPFAIFSGITLNTFYEKIKDKGDRPIYIIGIILLMILYTTTIPSLPRDYLEESYTWDALETDFDYPANNIRHIVEELAEPGEVIYADRAIVDRLIWSTGLGASNCGKYGQPLGYTPTTQRINVKVSPGKDNPLHYGVIIYVDYCKSKTGQPTLLPAICQGFCEQVCIKNAEVQK